MLRLGVHVSIAGGLSRAVERARELGCGTVQIFSRSPRGWQAAPLDPSEVERFKEGRKDAKISPLVIHASYLINLAATEDTLLEKSLSGLEEELSRADRLEADYLVVHVGSNAQRGPDFAIRRAVESLIRLKKNISTRTQILLENTAGERGDIGSRMKELADILSQIGDAGWLGLCLDTCHAFAAGYDLSRPAGVEAWVKEIETTVGLERVKVLHMNDSKKGLNCRVDRHEHIGQGKIGLSGFRAIVRHPKLRKIPMILETPKERPEDDRRNLDTLFKLCKP